MDLTCCRDGFGYKLLMDNDMVLLKLFTNVEVKDRVSVGSDLCFI